MMQINGRITTVHRNAGCVASSLAPDNLNSMTTTADGDHVTTLITGTQSPFSHRIRGRLSHESGNCRGRLFVFFATICRYSKTTTTVDPGQTTPGTNTVHKKNQGRNSSR